MGIKQVFRYGCIATVLCLVSSAVLFIVIVNWQDIQTEQVEPVVVGQFPLQQDWFVQLDGPVNIPLAIWEDKVFVRTLHSLYGLSKKDGSIIWQCNNLGGIDEEIIFARNGVVVASQDKQTILVLDAQTGSTIVSIHDSVEYAGIQSVAIDEQSVYIIQDDYLSVYDLDDGNLRWKNIGYGVDVFVNPQTDEFYLVGSQYITIFNRTTGKERQPSIMFLKESERFPYPNVYAASRQELLLARGDNLYIFDIATQAVRSTANTGKLEFYPRLVGNILYIANHAGMILAVDIVSGDILWHQQISEASWLQTPNLLGEYLFTKDQRNGRIYAISLSTKTVSGYIQVGRRHMRTYLPEGINPVTGLDWLIFTQGDRVYGYTLERD